MSTIPNRAPSPSYPTLEAILVIQNRPLQPFYSTRDLAQIFGVCVRAVQNWITLGRLTPRNLPGRSKFLPQDIEEFLKGSLKGGG